MREAAAAAAAAGLNREEPGSLPSVSGRWSRGRGAAAAAAAADEDEDEGSVGLLQLNTYTICDLPARAAFRSPSYTPVSEAVRRYGSAHATCFIEDDLTRRVSR